MKKGLKFAILTALIALLIIFAVSCNKNSDGGSTEDNTAIQTPNLKYENGVYVVNIGSSENNRIDLTSYFTVSSNASYQISKTEDFAETIDSVVDLVGGDNTFFVKVTDNSGNQKTYEFLFIVVNTYTVNFSIVGSDEVIPSVECEENGKIYAPSVNIPGYTVDWDFNFATSVTSNMTITGILVPNEYTITISAPGFDIDGSTVTVVYGELPAVEQPSKAGYDFQEWQYNGKKIDLTVPYSYADNITVNAVSVIHKYTITYNLLGGSNNTSNLVEYTVETDSFNLLDATWSNDEFAFGGWYLDSAYTQKVTSIDKGTTGNIELYAKWNEVEFATNVTISANGTDFDGNVIVLIYGESYDLSSYTKDGYKLLNWVSGDKTIPSKGVWNYKDASLTIEPVFELITYTITYNNLNGAINTNPTTFTCVDEITLVPLTWSDNSYTFIGWYIDDKFTQPFEGVELGTTENIVLYANCEVVVQEKFTNITFNAPGFDCDNQQADVKHGDSYELPVLEKLGYEFKGWKTADGELVFDAVGVWANESEELTLVPNFEIKEYSINYNPNGGVNNSQNPASYTINDAVSLLDATWSDGTYVFDGWYLDSALTEKFVDFAAGNTGDIYVYAKWKKVTDISIVAPGFECDNTELEFVFGEAYTMPDVSKEGYTLDGWKTQDGTIIIPSSGKWTREEKTLVLVPNWKPRTYSITYVLNGGTNNELNIHTAYTVEDNIQFYDPLKQYATFGGWYKEASFDNKIESTKGCIGNLVLYALWEYTSYDVELNPDNGSSKTTVQIVYGEEYTLTTPSKNGYTFDGWYDGSTLVPLTGTWLIERDVTLTAKWTMVTYTINYELDGGNKTGTGWRDSYNINSSNYTLPKPTKEGKIFLGWSTSEGGLVQTSITVKKGATGNLTFYANWCDEQSESGLMFNINADGTATVIGYNGVIGDITIPKTHDGHLVTAIASNAFNGYGEKIAQISSSTSFVKLNMPTSITSIGDNAFANCDDLKIVLTDDPKTHTAKTAEIEEWEKNLTIGSGNEQVVDVIKNLRPAIGWNLYVKP